MVKLTQASNELFNRTPDERFSSLSSLSDHCREVRDSSRDYWHPPSDVHFDNQTMHLAIGLEGGFEFNDWSFSQICRMAGVNKDTINRLSRQTAAQAFRETLPRGDKPWQFLTNGNRIRSLHGAAYTRLWNIDLVSLLQEFAVDFQPPQQGTNDATGLYAGEQDMFCFLIDPTGWAEIKGEAFAPGFFVWNSEVGRRSLGITTFWFQAVCANHIVWDAVEVIDWRRKHTSNVSEGLSEIRRIIESLVEKRDARRDGFVRIIEKAMSQSIGDTTEESLTFLKKHGVTRALGKKAIEIARKKGALTIWSIVDALTQLASEARNAGDRMEADAKAAKLLALV